MIEAPGPAKVIETIAVSNESTVVSEFVPDPAAEDGYQSEAQLEQHFIELLKEQAYERLTITDAASLEANLRTQLELLNQTEFSEQEWQRFFTETLAAKNAGIVEKTALIQEDHVQILHRDDGTTKNIYLLDKANVHNNRLQVINQSRSTARTRTAMT